MRIVKRKGYKFKDGEIGKLRKGSNGVYMIRSASHYISLNTTDYRTAIKMYKEKCNCYYIEVVGDDYKLKKGEEFVSL